MQLHRTYGVQLRRNSVEMSVQTRSKKNVRLLHSVGQPLYLKHLPMCLQMVEKEIKTYSLKKNKVFILRIDDLICFCNVVPWMSGWVDLACKESF